MYMLNFQVSFPAALLSLWNVKLPPFWGGPISAPEGLPVAYFCGSANEREVTQRRRLCSSQASIDRPFRARAERAVSWAQLPPPPTALYPGPWTQPCPRGEGALGEGPQLTFSSSTFPGPCGERSASVTAGPFADSSLTLHH